MYSSEVQMFSKCILWYFEYLTDLDTHIADTMF
jgi:hypothetical protein